MRPIVTFTIVILILTACTAPTAVPTIPPSPTLIPTPSVTSTPTLSLAETQALAAVNEAFRGNLSVDSNGDVTDKNGQPRTDLRYDLLKNEMVLLVDGQWITIDPADVSFDENGNVSAVAGYEQNENGWVEAGLTPEQQAGLDKMNESLMGAWTVDSETGNVTMGETQVPWVKYNFETNQMDFTYPYHAGLSDENPAIQLTESYGPGAISPTWDKDKQAYTGVQELGVFRMTENGWERQNFVRSNGKEIEGLKVFSQAEIWQDILDNHSEKPEDAVGSIEHMREMMKKVPREINGNRWYYTFGGMYEKGADMQWAENIIPVYNPTSKQFDLIDVSEYVVNTIGDAKQYALVVWNDKEGKIQIKILKKNRPDIWANWSDYFKTHDPS